jgi:hypothetical protein
VGKPEKKWQVEKPNRRENNIKMDIEHYLGGVFDILVGKMASVCEQYVNLSSCKQRGNFLYQRICKQPLNAVPATGC